MKPNVNGRNERKETAEESNVTSSEKKRNRERNPNSLI